MRLILASGSPRRSEILHAAGYEFEVIPSGEEEDIGPLPPQELVTSLALVKARSVNALNVGAVVIGADTIVSIGVEILGKPADEADAARMLRLLSGRVHTVFTGVAVVSDGHSEHFFARTAVRFRALDDALIARYVATGEPLDKAGAYGIQARGALLVESLEGDYFNIMGLPVARLAQRLESGFGIRPF
ncbi:MAG: Maf family protein [Clostridia bacterium]|nr:Maf family protein [Clostridia bacterium]